LLLPEPHPSIVPFERASLSYASIMPFDRLAIVRRERPGGESEPVMSILTDWSLLDGEYPPFSKDAVYPQVNQKVLKLFHLRDLFALACGIAPYGG
jgi:hypothetical protein